MSLDTTLEQIRELARLEVGRQVNEGQHKLNAKVKAAAHTIDGLQAKLRGARENLDAQKRRARGAEAHNKELKRQIAVLRPPLPEAAEESKKEPLADVGLPEVLAAVAAKAQQ